MPQHSADDAGGALSSSCEDITRSDASSSSDPSQAASIEGHCHRERLACHLAQLRPQGGRGGAVKFETRTRELVESLPDLAVLVEPLLIVRRVVRDELHARPRLT